MVYILDLRRDGVWLGISDAQFVDGFGDSVKFDFRAAEAKLVSACRRKGRVIVYITLSKFEVSQALVSIQWSQGEHIAPGFTLCVVWGLGVWKELAKNDTI